MTGHRYNPAMIQPGFGAMVTKQQEQRARQTPPFVQVGDLTSTNYGRPGLGGYLGRNFDPFLVTRDPNSSSFASR